MRESQPAEERLEGAELLKRDVSVLGRVRGRREQPHRLSVIVLVRVQAEESENKERLTIRGLGFTIRLRLVLMVRNTINKTGMLSHMNMIGAK